MQVIDTIGNINHTFLLNYEDDNDATFYNLVVHQNSQEDTPNAYVLKYHVNPSHFQGFKNRGYDFHNFEGTITRYSLDAFVSNTSTSQSTGKLLKSFGAVDECVCEEVTVGAGGSGGSGLPGTGYPSGPGGGSGGGGGGAAGGGASCFTEIIEVECDAGGGHTGGGQGCTSDTFEGMTISRTTCSDGSVTDTVLTDKSGAAKTEDDCLNPCEDKNLGDVGVMPLVSFDDIVEALGYSRRSGSGEQLAFLRNNLLVYGQVRLFLIQNDFSEEAIEFSKWNIEFEMLPKVPCGINHDCVKSIKTMATGLRRFHGEEGKLMADYFDSLVADFSTFSLADLQVFYDTAYDITTQFNANMRRAIIGGFIEGVTPIIEIALLEVGGPVAIKLLKKIPVSWVLRGTRLNKMVTKVAQLGVQGDKVHVRVVTTSSPITKAKELLQH